jgi:hypothetical protein
MEQQRRAVIMWRGGVLFLICSPAGRYRLTYPLSCCVVMESNRVYSSPEKTIFLSKEKVEKYSQMKYNTVVSGES